MPGLHAWFCRLLGLFRKNSREAEMAEEFRQHLDLLTERNIAAGMSYEEARNAALRQFGGVEQIKETAREQRVWMWAHQLWQDVVFACRLLRKSPAFTVVALVTLMLGIGANVVVFGIVNAVLLHPLDVSDPQNLYQIRLKPWTSFKLLTTSYPAFEDFRQRNTTFSGMTGFYGYSQARLRWGNAVMSVSGYEVTGNYFDLLGVQPEVGRFFHAADEHCPNSAPYVVLSDSLCDAQLTPIPA
jgi:MacB-like periplasmic core domain